MMRMCLGVGLSKDASCTENGKGLIAL
jgi:hypothetical protein